jgi:hypothetical protein
MNDYEKSNKESPLKRILIWIGDDKNSSLNC